MSTTPIIRVARVAKSFSARPHPTVVFRDVSVEIPRGAITGLVGANGCGKTTLLNMLVGNTAPDAGTIWVADVPITPDSAPSTGPAPSRASVLAHARRVCAWHPEHPLLPRAWSGREVLRDWAMMLGVPAPAVGAALDAIARTLPLAAFWERPARGYSRGQAALVSLARIALRDCPVWLLDEPTAALDAATVARVRAWLRREAADNGRTIVVSTHLWHDAATLFDRVIRLADGVAHPLDPGVLADHAGGVTLHPEGA